MKKLLQTRRSHAILCAVVCVLVAFSLAIGIAAGNIVYPGGMPFGVKFSCDGLMIVGFSEIEDIAGSGAAGGKNPAYDAGLRLNDMILAIDDVPVRTAEDFSAILGQKKGSISIRYRRDGQEGIVTLTPIYSEAEQKYKTGMWVRDTTAGIGTVTFLLPDSGVFAGLGHGICDQTTGKLLPMRRGSTMQVLISGISRGKSGRPGELIGYFSGETSGVLLGNTNAGVYGILDAVPREKIPEDKLELADRSEVQEGDAYIWCTLDNGKPCRYAISIGSLHTDNPDYFSITVADPALIAKTGGIVQGMSGSPIVQNGKLVGAVTHVLVGNPCEGYGIYIDSMCRNMPALFS